MLYLSSPQNSLTLSNNILWFFFIFFLFFWAEDFENENAWRNDRGGEAIRYVEFRNASFLLRVVDGDQQLNHAGGAAVAGRSAGQDSELGGDLEGLVGARRSRRCREPGKFQRQQQPSQP